MLSDMQKRFCEYYVTSANASDSYKKAGFKVKSDNVAKSAASRLLTKVNVMQYIEELRAVTKINSIASIIEIKEFWTDIIRKNAKDYESRDRLKASELLAKSEGAFVDKIEQKSDITVKIEGEIEDWAK